MGFSAQAGQGEVGDGLKIEDGRLDPDFRFWIEVERGSQGRAVNGEEGEVRSGGDGEVERESERNGLAESVLDPVERGGVGMREGEEIEQKGAGSGFFEVRAERGGEGSECGLVLAFEKGVGGKKGELWTAGESTSGGESGSDAMTRGRLVDGEQDGSGARLC